MMVLMAVMMSVINDGVSGGGDSDEVVHYNDHNDIGKDGRVSVMV